MRSIFLLIGMISVCCAADIAGLPPLTDRQLDKSQLIASAQMASSNCGYIEKTCQDSGYLDATCKYADAQYVVVPGALYTFARIKFDRKDGPRAIQDYVGKAVTASALAAIQNAAPDGSQVDKQIDIKSHTVSIQINGK